MISSQQTEYEFELHLAGISKINKNVEDRLFLAGCDDATLSSQNGKVSLVFSRESTSLKDAIISAISDVNSSDISVTVLGVDLCEPNETGHREELLLINEMIQLFYPLEQKP